jgi:hypothetical protein
MQKILAWGLVAGVIAAGSPSYAQTPEGCFLFPGSQVTVPVGGKVNLHTMQMNSFSNLNVFSAEWTLNGKPWAQADPDEGKLSEALFSGAAVYTAPQHVPAKNPVMVTVAFQLSDKEKTKVYLSCAITVTEVENYVSVSSPYCNEYFEYLEPSTEFAKQNMSLVNVVNGSLHLNINGAWKKDLHVPLNLNVIINGPPAVGTYPWSYPEAPSMANISAGNYKGQQISLASADCVPHYQKTCQAMTLSGSTTITVFDKKKKILQGYYSGVVMGTRQNQYYYGSVYGRFTAHLQ